MNLDTAVYAVPLLTGLCDRLRGWEHGPGKIVSCVPYGMALAYALDMPYWSWPIVGAAWWAGAIPGWGYPMGQIALGFERHAKEHPNAKPEKWQMKLGLENEPEVSLLARGAFWGLCGMIPCIALGEWRSIALLTMGLWMVLCAEIDGVLIEAGRNPRGNMEFVRGLLLGCATLIIGRFA